MGTVKMKARDYRKQAWQAMAGKWGSAALITFVWTLVVGALTATGLGALLCTGPLELGYTSIVLNISRGKDISVGQSFDGFKRFGDSLVLMLTNAIFIFLWSLLFFIPGIIKAFSYSMSFFVLQDNPGMTAGEARKRSIQLMKGNKWRLFCLCFSFIGWFILTAMTGGILMFWVLPYMQTAMASFYQSLVPVEEAEVPEAPEATEEA